MDVQSNIFKAFDIDVKFNEPMKRHTFIGVGGNAKYFTQIKSLCSFNYVIQTAREHKIPFKIIGNGSNVLVSDKGYDGLIISTQKLSDVFFKKDCVRAMCGATLKSLACFLENAGLSGMESLAHIPATVGGAVVQNAGAFGENISDNLVSVETLCRGKIKVYDKNECKFGYRTSRFKFGKEAVLSATFNFNKANKTDITEKSKKFLLLRKNKFPTGKNCGSVFVNPKGLYAGSLIERAGLKGTTFGGASVSKKHANFIECSSLATADDVFRLIQYVKKKIYDVFNVELVEEVEYVGEF